VRFLAPVNCRELESLSGVQILSTVDSTDITLQVTGAMDRLIKALGAYPVAEIETSRPSLEEAFLAYYKKENG
jgi:ABC-2 type transport system ATP-binding protein